MVAIELILSAIAIIMMVPVAILLIQVLSACFLKARFDISDVSEASVAVLVPAHNEASGIVDTLQSLQSQLSDNDTLLVVADNCDDNTAEIARKLGAEVVERFDENLRGKGYALDYGICHLQDAPKDVLMIVDADCLVEAGGIQKIARYAVKHNRPVQALYLMYRQQGATLKSAVAEFAWTVKNWVRPLGFAKLGLPCQLMGTGMAFPWEVLDKMDLANGHIVEDMKLGVDLAVLGYPPLFYPDAKVTSYFPLATDTQKGQSKRWEHGHLSVMLGEMPELLWSGLKRGQSLVVAMALDLSIPPLALLVGLLLVFAFLASLFFYGFSAAAFAFVLCVMNVMILLVSVIFAWYGFGQRIISLGQLLYIPVYILQKIPNYFSFILKRQTAWNKTKRDQEVE